MGKTDKKAKVKKAPAATTTPAPPTQLLDLVEGFLSDHSFKNAHEAFQKQRAKAGLNAGASKPKGDLIKVYQTWESSTKTVSGQKDKAESSDSSDSSDSDSDSSSSSSEGDVDMADADSSDSSSDSDSEDEASTKIAVPVKNLKRKAASESSDSSSDSSDSDSSSDKKARQVKKKLKTVKKDDSSSDSSSSSSSSSSDSSDSSDSEKEVKGKKATKSDSDSDSDSSDSSSSSDSSDSEDEKPAASKKEKKTKKTVVEDTPSDSSVTLDKTSPDFQAPPLPPDPTTFKNNNRGKTNGNGARKPNTPFSRIAEDTYVDPKFASNEYVPNTYSQRAHEDLIVTKGKGFTKEKNKKKKGSYRGGAIDIGGRGGVKFDY